MTNCQVCGSDLKMIPAGVSKKTGKPYKAFAACPKGCKSNWNDTTTPQLPKNDFNFQNYVADEFVALNKRLDNLAKFLVQHLPANGNPGIGESAGVDVKDIKF